MEQVKYQPKEYTGKEINNFRIALGMFCIAVDQEAVELIIHALDAYKEMGGQLDLDTASRIVANNQEKHKKG